MPEPRMLVISTTSDDPQALLKLASLLLEQQLAACCQVDQAPTTSLYRWEGQIQQSTEYRCLIKTLADHWEAVRQLIRDHHPYECPQIVATELVSVDGDYRDWARQACGAPPEPSA